MTCPDAGRRIDAGPSGMLISMIISAPGHWMFHKYGCVLFGALGSHATSALRFHRIFAALADSHWQAKMGHTLSRLSRYEDHDSHSKLSRERLTNFWKHLYP